MTGIVLAALVGLLMAAPATAPAAAESPAEIETLAGDQCVADRAIGDKAPDLGFEEPEPILLCSSGYDCPFGYCPFIQDMPPGECVNGCCYYDPPCETTCELSSDCGAIHFWRCVGGCCEPI